MDEQKSAGQGAYKAPFANGASLAFVKVKPLGFTEVRTKQHAQ